MGVSEQGVSLDRYTVIPRVLVFPVNGADQVLLLHGAPNKRIWANRWNGIGGHVEAGESILRAARRELLEEANLTAARLKFVGQVMVDTGGNPGIAFFVFKATDLSGELKASEEGALAWFELEEALELPLVEDLYTILPMVMGGGEAEKPFWGLYTYDEDNQLCMSFSR
ncbi:MAG: NUDIX domain-containing protein [Anaerolineaceae bacterium]|nr:NUDIX domain-containing protein [Anaerolineaceae bacterium]HNX46719.1 NUDIX domain-containing protein [Anaerolineaceae bacterium]HPT23123.1 NUDIX domain-containing protein [Anaerolineaceae bacterium]